MIGRLAAGACALALVAVAGGPAQAAGEDAVLGSPDAPVTMIEYASLTCPHCAAFHNETLPELKERYIDTGQVKLVLRDFPLDRVALQASAIAHCAGPVRYAGFVDVMFRTQASWARAEDPVAALTDLARQGGLSADAVQACLADEALLDRIVATRLEAQEQYDIRQTPSFVIDGEVYAGDRGVDGFVEIIEPLLPKG